MTRFILVALSVLAISTPVEVRADAVADAVNTTAMQLRKQLPMRVDEKTTLMAIVAAGRTLKYSFHLDYAENELPSEWERLQTTRLRHNVCNHSTMLEMAKRGVTYAYLYLDSAGYFVAEIRIKHADC